jgi:hypothetical protein
LGASKVNPVYSKMPVEKGFMQSRDATVNLVYISEAHRDCTVQYSIVLKKSGFLKVNPIHVKTSVKSDVTQSRDAKTAMNFPGIKDSLTKTPIRVVSKGS